MLATILIVFAFVFACIAAFLQEPVWRRVHFGWAAVAFWLASLLTGHFGLR